MREFWRRGATAACVGVLVVALAGCAEPKAEPSDSKPVAAKVKNGTTTVKKQEPIPFETHQRRSAQVKKGERKVLQPGHRGVRVTTWRITTKNGKVVDRTKVKTVVAKKPAARIVLIGTRTTSRQVQSGCHPSYSPCVPISGDVDCSSGGGDGPSYVAGPVKVLGSDPYDLDSDGDGWGCVS